MRRSRYTEEQIIGILKEQEAGMPVMELCRKHGISALDIRAHRREDRTFACRYDSCRRKVQLLVATDSFCYPQSACHPILCCKDR
jgi:transposase